jgi:hypothetical protein
MQNSLKIGLFGVGLDAYCEQFEGLGTTALDIFKLPREGLKYVRLKFIMVKLDGGYQWKCQ